MYICLDCGKLFETQRNLREDHGEITKCCPECYGDFMKTFRCDSCGNWIDDYNYHQVKKKKYCSDCCVNQTIG